MAVQLFIGGACAGKRNAVAARWPHARWQALMPGQRLGDALDGCWEGRVEEQSSDTVVLYGLYSWLEGSLVESTDDDALRRRWRTDLDALGERFADATLIIIGHEIGCGIVPVERFERRLRDMNGWFNQDVAACAERVWRVRHGLVMAL